MVLILRGIWCAIFLAALAALRVRLHWLPVALPALILVALVCVEAFARRLGDRDEEMMRRHFARLFAPHRI